MNNKRKKGAVGIKQIVVIGVLVVAGLALMVMYNKYVQREKLEAERQAEAARLERERAEEAARAASERGRRGGEETTRGTGGAREGAKGTR